MIRYQEEDSFKAITRHIREGLVCRYVFLAYIRLEGHVNVQYIYTYTQDFNRDLLRYFLLFFSFSTSRLTDETFISQSLGVTPSTKLEDGIQDHSDEQRRAEERRAVLVVVFDGPTRANSLTAVQVDAHGVHEREDGHEREDACCNKRDGRRLGAKVEECRCDSANVD